MKKLTMYLMGALAALAVTACTPTPEKQTTAKSAEPAEKVEMSTGGASDKVPDPNAVIMEQMSVYELNEAGTAIVKQMEAVETLDAQSVVDKLIEFKVLDEGTQALSFDTKETSGVLNLSQLPEGDKQKLVVASVANTFIENFGLETLELQVNGQRFAGADGALEFDESYETPGKSDS